MSCCRVSIAWVFVFVCQCVPCAMCQTWHWKYHRSGEYVQYYTAASMASSLSCCGGCGGVRRFPGFCHRLEIDLYLYLWSHRPDLNLNPNSNAVVAWVVWCRDWSIPPDFLSSPCAYDQIDLIGDQSLFVAGCTVSYRTVPGVQFRWMVRSETGMWCDVEWCDVVRHGCPVFAGVLRSLMLLGCLLACLVACLLYILLVREISISCLPAYLLILIVRRPSLLCSLVLAPQLSLVPPFFLYLSSSSSFLFLPLPLSFFFLDLASSFILGFLVLSPFRFPLSLLPSCSFIPRYPDSNQIPREIHRY